MKAHIREIKRFLTTTNIDTSQATVDEVREYLSRFKDVNPYVYKNILASLKLFFRDFMKMGSIVESFKFPLKMFNPPHVPSKDELRKFYGALSNQKEKALFLTYASSGLRRMEVLSHGHTAAHQEVGSRNDCC